MEYTENELSDLRAKNSLERLRAMQAEHFQRTGKTSAQEYLEMKAKQKAEAQAQENTEPTV